MMVGPNRRTKLVSAAAAAMLLLFVQQAAAQADEIAAIRKELQTEVQAGRYEQAVKVSERLIAKLEANYPEPNEQHVAAYTDHGVIQQNMGQHAQAIPTLQKALELASIAAPKVKPETRVDIMRLLATGYDRSGDGRSAREAYLMAVEFAEANGSGNSKVAFYVALGAANALANDSKYEQAHQYYLRALRLSYEHFEVDSKERHDLMVYRTCLYKRNSNNSKRANEYGELSKELSEKEVKEKNVVLGKALRLGRPGYPAAARSAYIGGTVYVSISIDAEGNVTDAVAVCSVRELMAESEAAAKKTKFSPTLKDGKPIPVKGLLTFNFVPPR